MTDKTDVVAIDVVTDVVVDVVADVVAQIATALTSDHDWTRGGDSVFFQRCVGCHHTWYFQRDFCPTCGVHGPQSLLSAGRGIVHTSTLVHRAPSDEFRALAPYRLLLVDLAEGFRMMGHGDAALLIGDAVQGQIRTIAGRALPYFDRYADPASTSR